MTDLPERLRDHAEFADRWDEAFDGGLLREAAAEIERLRSEKEQLAAILREPFVRAVADIVAARIVDQVLGTPTATD